MYAQLVETGLKQVQAKADMGEEERAFQARVGLAPTGAVDDALRQKLLAYYHPGQDEREHDAKGAVGVES